MAAKDTTATISVRLSKELHQASRELAQRLGVSLNALVQDSLSTAVRAQQEQELFDSFTLLGQDLDECDVEFAMEAQREVARRDGA